MKILLQKISYILLSDVVVRILGFLTFAYIARISDHNIFGILSIGISVLNYTAILASPGLHILGIKYISQKLFNDKLLLTKISNIRFLISIFVIFILSLFIFFSTFSTDILFSVMIYSLSLIPLAFQVEWFLQAKENTDHINKGRILNALIFFILIFFNYKNSTEWYIVPISFFISNVIQTIYLQIVSNKLIDNNILNSLNSIELIKNSLPLGYSSIATQAVLHLPIVILAFLSPIKEVSLFSASLKLLFFILAFDRIIYLVLFPFISKIANNKNKLQYFLNPLLNWLLVLAGMLSFVLFINSEFILQLVYGDSFILASSYFDILLIFFVATLFNSIVGYALISLGEIKLFSKIITMFSLLILIIYPISIYYFGTIGAAITLSIGEIIIVSTLYYYLNTKIQLNVSYFKILSLIYFSLIVINLNSHLYIINSLIVLCIFIIGSLSSKIIKVSDIHVFKEISITK